MSAAPRGLTDEVCADWAALARPTEAPLDFARAASRLPEPAVRWLTHAIAAGTPLRTARLVGLPITGFDRYTRSTGQMRWRLLDATPVMSASGDDVARSTAGRHAGKLLLAASAAALGPQVTWQRPSDRARAGRPRHPRPVPHDRPQRRAHRAPDGTVGHSRASARIASAPPLHGGATSTGARRDPECGVARAGQRAGHPQ